MTEPSQAPRFAWSDAVWASDLRPSERLVALVYAKFAGVGLDCVWVDGETLRNHTRLSRDTVNRALRNLEVSGWLVVTEKARQHRSTRYRLEIPQHSDSRNADESSVTPVGTLSGSSVPKNDASVPTVRSSVPMVRASVPIVGNEPNQNQIRTLPKTGERETSRKPEREEGGFSGLPAEAAAALRSAGLRDELHAKALELARQDPSTKVPEKRLAVPFYAREIANRLKPRPGSSVWDKDVTGLGQRSEADAFHAAAVRLRQQLSADHLAGEHVNSSRYDCPRCAAAAASEPQEATG